MDVDIYGGGAHVDVNFNTYLWNVLDSYFEDQEDILGMLSEGYHDFEGRCKRAFANPSTSCTIRIGPRRMNIGALRITKGVLTLDGYGAIVV